jgi:hypothetical protein
MMSTHTLTGIGNRIIFFMAIALFANFRGLAQDTLHLNYNQVQTVLADTSIAKIEKWVKKLNGQHVNISVYCYYSKPEFKKYAQQRADELFLELNRKARNIITIDFIGPKRGDNWQRSMADVVYVKSLTPAEIKAKQEADAKKAEEAKALAKAEKDAEKAKKDSEKPKKEGDKAEKGKKETANDDKSEKTKSEVAEGQTDKKGKGKKEDKEEKKDGDEEDQDDANYGQASSRSYNEGNGMSAEELQIVKKGKFIVAQTGNKTIDDNLYQAVKQFWDFNPNVVQMGYDDARKMAKENKKDTMTILSFIQVKTWWPEKHGPVTIKILRIGYALALENGKGKLLMKQFIRKDKGQLPPLPYFAFGVSFLNNLCHVMDDNKLSKSSKADEFFDLNAMELKNKTLYIAEYQLHKNLPREDVPKYYTHPVHLVTDKMWEDAILQKKDVAYVMVIRMPRSPLMYYHYLMDAKTGKTYLIDFPKGLTLSAGFNTNFNPSQSGFIDKANFERYEEGITKAEKDNVERADDKAKDAVKNAEKAAKKEKDAEAKKAKDAEKASKDEAKKKEKEEKDNKAKEEKAAKEKK